MRKHRDQIMWAAVVAVLAFFFAALAHAIEIVDVRLRHHPDKTRLVFDLSAPGEL